MSEVRITVNGKPRSVSTGLSIASLLQELGVDLGHVAVERNEEVVPRKTWPESTICDGDRIEVVAFMGGGSGGACADALVIGGKAFRSRLLVGTGKYRSIEETRKAIEASGAEIVTVALRRVDLAPGAATVLDAMTGKIVTFIPVSREPEGAGVSPDGKFFYITCETAGDVFAIDAKTFKIIGHIVVHPRPRSVAFLPDGSRAFIPSELVGELNVIDTASQTLLKVITLPPHSRPQCVVVAPDGKKVYVSTGRGGTVCVVDAHTYEVLNTIPVGRRPWGIAISPDGKYLFSANGPSDDVSVVDLATEKEIARVKSPGSPWGVVAVPVAK